MCSRLDALWGGENTRECIPFLMYSHVEESKNREDKYDVGSTEARQSGTEETTRAVSKDWSVQSAEQWQKWRSFLEDWLTWHRCLRCYCKWGAGSCGEELKGCGGLLRIGQGRVLGLYKEKGCLCLESITEVLRGSQCVPPVKAQLCQPSCIQIYGPLNVWAQAITSPL